MGTITNEEIDRRIEDVISLIYSQAWMREPKNVPFTQSDVRFQARVVKAVVEQIIANHDSLNIRSDRIIL